MSMIKRIGMKQEIQVAVHVDARIVLLMVGMMNVVVVAEVVILVDSAVDSAMIALVGVVVGVVVVVGLVALACHPNETSLW